jgi:hypothetical protein
MQLLRFSFWVVPLLAALNISCAATRPWLTGSSYLVSGSDGEVIADTVSGRCYGPQGTIQPCQEHTALGFRTALGEAAPLSIAIAAIRSHVCSIIGLAVMLTRAPSEVNNVFQMSSVAAAAAATAAAKDQPRGLPPVTEISSKVWMFCDAP